MDTFNKVAYQGAFDNVHMSPKMKLFKVGKVTHKEPGGFNAEPLVPPSYEIDQSTLHLNDITMAPFCAHDCFHLHWRWSTDANDTPQRGFAGMVPNAKVGAPQVPGNQTVQVWLRAPNKLTYTATVWGFPGIAVGEWQTIMHHGGSYALDATAFLMISGAKIVVDQFAGQPEFSDDSGTTISSRQSWSLMYWRLRWETVLVGGKPVLRERVQLRGEVAVGV